ncbi:arabinogalactan endo-1,4-beta-galactosidase [Paenibacillus timonensis]|uniref:Arabinogalactan endo-beta-1,4-galactanase n=1 Tax=Paenibacillus timonensis TaxID=225915 RepID=A0ABW3SID8_9BACL|nr:glycosyl hydrolase 53 family protein [Paenibacillus timonensis]MCH1642042.1 arabinogalactan endo-1,4-beta-galactosidase [Paenibacillus timonensis]
MTRPVINGMDVSFLDEIEVAGGTFAEDGAKEDLLVLLKRSGVNSIRLRIWNEPPGGFCNLERTLLMAKRIKALGYARWMGDRILLVGTGLDSSQIGVVRRTRQ